MRVVVVSMVVVVVVVVLGEVVVEGMGVGVGHGWECTCLYSGDGRRVARSCHRHRRGDLNPSGEVRQTGEQRGGGRGGEGSGRRGARPRRPIRHRVQRVQRQRVRARGAAGVNVELAQHVNDVREVVGDAHQNGVIGGGKGGLRLAGGRADGGDLRGNVRPQAIGHGEGLAKELAELGGRHHWLGGLGGRRRRRRHRGQLIRVLEDLKVRGDVAEKAADVVDARADAGVAGGQAAAAAASCSVSASFAALRRKGRAGSV